MSDLDDIMPDDIHALLTSTEPDAEEKLRERARAIANFAMTVARAEDHADTNLTTLARLVLAGDSEASVMAEVVTGKGAAGRDLFPDEVLLAKGRARISASGWLARTIAVESMKLLDTTGAINYVELPMAPPGEQKATVLLTVQRMERPTPHDLRRAAEDRERASVAQVADALSRLTEAASLTDALRSVVDTLQRCDLDASGAFAMWRLDDFTVACDACREKSNAQGGRCRAEREMPYAPALRALLAHPAWFVLTNGYGR
jgi:hypothetical protein